MLNVKVFGGKTNFCNLKLWKGLALRVSKSYSTEASSQYSFETLAVSVPSDHVYHVEINRPEKRNSMNKLFYRELGDCFNLLGEDSSCRAVVLSGRGKVFSAGIDMSDLIEMGSIVMQEDLDVARKSRTLKKTMTDYQKSYTALEKCPKPVIVAVHGACIGAALELTCSTDIRYCTSDAWFQIKEVDVGFAADIGTLQRLPKIIGSESLVRELCFTARKFFSNEAKDCGFVSRIFPDRKTLIESCLELGKNIAEKSPVAVQATKNTLIHARDHSVDEGLDYIANLNMIFLQSEDAMKAAMASLSKDEDKPSFANL